MGKSKKINVPNVTHKLFWDYPHFAPPELLSEGICHYIKEEVKKKPDAFKFEELSDEQYEKLLKDIEAKRMEIVENVTLQDVIKRLKP